MSLYRYRAIPTAGGNATTGELSADSPADARAALRRIGLRVIDLRPMRRSGAKAPGAPAEFGPRGVLAAAGSAWSRHLRTRRRALRAEMCDGLATMLDAGLSLEEAVGALLSSQPPRSGARPMLARVRAQVRDGLAFPEAARAEPAWFDEAEAAMLDAGHHTGKLASVLHTLAERHQRAGELSGRLAAALGYPVIVAIVGVGVVVFLSLRTLPELAGILNDAGVEVPLLTTLVMRTGRAIVESWWIAGVGAAVLMTAMCLALIGLRRRAPHLLDAAARRLPRTLRELAVARLLMLLAELVRTGVPVTESLRVAARTIDGPTGAGLAPAIRRAAETIERGSDVASALAQTGWLDDEQRRLLELAERTGELDAVLERLGTRADRRARRTIDALARALEPAVILVLAAAIGVVVMAAVLPLVRLQEIL